VKEAERAAFGTAPLAKGSVCGVGQIHVSGREIDDLHGGGSGSIATETSLTSRCDGSQGSTSRRQSSILLHVHPGPHGQELELRNPSLSTQPPMKNLHSFENQPAILNLLI
jgi:hypothetical protein